MKTNSLDVLIVYETVDLTDGQAGELAMLLDHVLDFCRHHRIRVSIVKNDDRGRPEVEHEGHD